MKEILKNNYLSLLKHFQKTITSLNKIIFFTVCERQNGFYFIFSYTNNSKQYFFTIETFQLISKFKFVWIKIKIIHLITKVNNIIINKKKVLSYFNSLENDTSIINE